MPDTSKIHNSWIINKLIPDAKNKNGVFLSGMLRLPGQPGGLPFTGSYPYCCVNQQQAATCRHSDTSTARYHIRQLSFLSAIIARYLRLRSACSSAAVWPLHFRWAPAAKRRAMYIRSCPCRIWHRAYRPAGPAPRHRSSQIPACSGRPTWRQSIARAPAPSRAAAGNRCR